MYCPIEPISLHLVILGGEVAHRCTKCRGLWLPHAFVAAALHKVGSDDEALVARLQDGQDAATFHACPAGCLATLVRSELGGVALEWCGVCHGLWLDPLELTRAQLEREARTTRHEAASPAAILDALIEPLQLVSY